jgi:hypothetical protein
MNNLSYDKSAYEEKLKEYQEYDKLLFNTNNKPCLGSSQLSSGGVKNIDAENQLFGYAFPLSKTNSVKPVPQIKEILPVCNNTYVRQERERDYNDNPREKSILGFFLQILPFDVQKNFRQFNYSNSRQIAKDIKEKSLNKN